MKTPLFVAAFLALQPLSLAASYLDWETYKANGVNLGGWLIQENSIDTTWWAQYSKGAEDEWGLCAHQGAQCGPILERRYATYITPADIDKLHGVGVNTLRIPTTYAAWVRVPGSQLYTGNQVRFLKNIATYAITKYGMHVIIDVHSLPGGVNGMPFGEAAGHYGWFNNQTALRYSLEAIDAVISYVKESSSPESYTIAPINEPIDNRDMAAFGTPDALSEDGAAWLLGYIQEVVSRVEAVNPQIPVMFQGSFKGEAYWSSKFPSNTNLVFDVHNYYFAGRGLAQTDVPAAICSDAKASAGDGRFPVFIGEWSIQAEYNNTLAGRAVPLNTGLYSWAKYTQGNAYWTAKFSGNARLNGEGSQKDYWDYMTWINLGLIDPSEGEKYCS
ncbi:hypothetical protein BBP40_009942 [Aspergillus hancockii]|nr:hypothetical protein BBP40_009942 [Aspergillus hancockii]